MILTITIVLATILFWRIRRSGWAIYIAILVTAIIYPKVVLWPNTTQYVGIAGRNLSLQTYAVIGITALLFLTCRSPILFIQGCVPWLPFLVASAYSAFAYWPHDSLTNPGLVHVYVGIVMFLVAFIVMRDERLPDRVILRAVAAITTVQVIFVASDYTSHPLYEPKQALAGYLSGRAIGTTGHPDQLAKVVLCLLILNVMIQDLTVKERRIQIGTTVALLTITGLTQGRAAFIGAVTLVVLDVLLRPSSRARGRWPMLLGAALVSAGAYGSLAQRFQDDPNGGDRDYLATVADHVIALYPLHGVGLNHFVSVVGVSDPIVGSGVPVHNAFLLSAAEMGIPVALLLWLPMGYILFYALRYLRAPTEQGNAARALAAATPAFILITVTGWGLLQSPAWELFLLVLGTIYGQMRRPNIVLSSKNARELDIEVQRAPV